LTNFHIGFKIYNYNSVAREVNMVGLKNFKTYYLNGELLSQAEAKLRPDFEQKSRAAKSIAQKILDAHNVSADQKRLSVKFDALASHDITYVGIIQTAKASGLERFPDKLPQQPLRRRRHHKRGRPYIRTVRRPTLWRHIRSRKYRGHSLLYA
jgi:hypothetical protein